MIGCATRSFFPRFGAAALFAVLVAGSGCAHQMSRGSEKSLYTISGVLEVFRADLGKDIQLRLNQSLLFRLEKDPALDGHWELVDYDRQLLLLLSDTPRVKPEEWGLLLQARAYGRGELKLRYVPAGEGETPRETTLAISISR